MENIKSIEHVLENMDPNIVYKTKDSIWTGLLFLIAGALFFGILSIGSWAPSSSVPQLLLVLGITSLIPGVLKLFLRKSHFVSAANHQKLKSFEIHFEATERDKLVRLYENGKVKDVHLLKSAQPGGLKIKVMATKDLSLCFSQVIGYVPFEFRPLTAPVQHTPDEAAYLKSLVK